MAYISAAVDEELFVRNEDLVAENCILCNPIKGRVQLSDAERQILVKIGNQTESTHPLRAFALLQRPNGIVLEFAAWTAAFDASDVAHLPKPPSLDCRSLAEGCDFKTQSYIPPDANDVSARLGRPVGQS